MGTNTVLKICPRCRHATAVSIEAVDRYNPRTILCERCEAQTLVEAGDFDHELAQRTRERVKAADVWGDLRKPPTDEMRAMFIPKLSEPKPRPKRVYVDGSGQVVKDAISA